jgi:hypothetical protein
MKKENIAYYVYYPLQTLYRLVTLHDPLLTCTNWATNL